MRKIFSLLAAVLFAGSMMAAEVTTTYVFHSSAWKANVNDVSSDWTSNQNGGGFMNNGVQVTSSSTGASATSPKSFNQISKIVVTYNTNKTAGKGSLMCRLVTMILFPRNVDLLPVQKMDAPLILLRYLTMRHLKVARLDLP